MTETPQIPVGLTNGVQPLKGETRVWLAGSLSVLVGKVTGTGKGARPISDERFAELERKYRPTDEDSEVPAVETLMKIRRGV
jgi:hypothetical protein